jgi:hypothetical protein
MSIKRAADAQADPDELFTTARGVRRRLLDVTQ